MPSDAILLADRDFAYIRTLAKENAAIVIENDKRYLVETRLSPLAEQEGFKSLTALIQALRAAEDLGRLHLKAIDALTTNETLFFRDRHPFDALAKSVLPELMEARRREKRLRIWSAASSTGQEAYSIAMLLNDKFPELASWEVTLTGTDISETVLEQARSGTYLQHEVNRGLPASMLIKYFTQDGARKWTLRPEIRKMVRFETFNLMGDWGRVPDYDLIFIRNVLIYFDNQTKRDILGRIAQRLLPGGYMVLGSAETPVTVTGLFKPVPVDKAVFYQSLQDA